MACVQTSPIYALFPLRCTQAKVRTILLVQDNKACRRSYGLVYFFFLSLRSVSRLTQDFVHRLEN